MVFPRQACETQAGGSVGTASSPARAVTVTRRRGKGIAAWKANWEKIDFERHHNRPGSFIRRHHNASRSEGSALWRVHEVFYEMSLLQCAKAHDICDMRELLVTVRAATGTVLFNVCGIAASASPARHGVRPQPRIETRSRVVLPATAHRAPPRTPVRTALATLSHHWGSESPARRWCPN